MLPAAQKVASSARSLSSARAGLEIEKTAAQIAGASKATSKAICDVRMIFKRLPAMRRHLEHDRDLRAAGFCGAANGNRRGRSAVDVREFHWSSIMKSILLVSVIAIGAFAAASPADAKGCIKGAVVGGVAGHYAGHHGMLGAAAGCLYGRHHAKEQERQRQQQQAQPSQQEKL